MSVVQTMEEVGPCRRQLTIEVPRPAVDAETDRVVGEYRREAQLPGFRKGKAPRSLVERRFGKEIRQQVIDRLVPRYWHQAEAEKELEVLMPPALESVDFELGEGMTFRAIVETRPEITLGDIESFELPEMETEAGEEEVDQQVEDLQRSVGTWSNVDRPAARGDQIVGEIARDDEEEPRRIMLEVGDERAWEELTLAVTGLKAGQESSFEHAEGDEQRRYHVRVDEVRELELAAADDELAATVSQFETLDELRVQIRRTIEDAKRRERRRRREHAVLEQLRDRHPVDLPQGVVDHDLDGIVRDYAHSLAHQGVDIETAEIDWAAIAEQLRPEAEKAVHSRLVLDAVAHERDISVPEERLEAMLAEIAQARKMTPLAVRRELDSSGRLASLRKQLRREETIGALLGDEPMAVQSPTDDEESSEPEGGE